MTLTRRRFIRQTTPLLAGPTALGSLVSGCVREDDPELAVEQSALVDPFRHGVASGDPLADAVILWTRITPPDDWTRAVEVAWQVARDPELSDVVAQGVATTDPELDYTVKVDAGGLEPGATYFYGFSVLDPLQGNGARTGDEPAAEPFRSRVGRTRTLPVGEVARLRLAVTSCANYPAGYFNAYRRIAERSDLDLVLHLGDYIYEFGNGTLGDGTAIGRLPSPNYEAVSLDDYRERHAQYKSDADLQEVHRQHPFVVIWDDHEVADNSFRDGAVNHQPASEGEWEDRKRSAIRAYFEWMPIRGSGVAGEQRVYRSFEWGDLARLVMLDTRLEGRDAHITGNCDLQGIINPERNLLGQEQEAWFLGELSAFSSGAARWCLVGQQVMMGQLSDLAEGCVSSPDQWDGYAASRSRVLEALRDGAVDNVVVLTGDAHASWAMDIADNPFDPASYDAATGDGSLAVEFVAPGISSPGVAGDVAAIVASHPHAKFSELTRQGYVLLDVTPERTQAEWYFVGSVVAPSNQEELAAVFLTRDAQNRLEAAAEPSLPGEPRPLAP